MTEASQTHDGLPVRSEATPAGSLCSLPFGVAFLDGLARAILDGDLPRFGGPKPDIIDLPGITILLPTRRAERALGAAFRKASGESALLLPQIRAVSERNDDEALMSSYLEAQTGSVSPGSGLLPLPPAMPPIERQMVLMTLVGKWSEAVVRGDGDQSGKPRRPAARTPAQVAALARELGQMLDLIETEGVSLDALSEIVPEDYSAHWEQTLGFLEIITQFWPLHQQATGGMTAVERRNALIRAEADRLRATPPSGPVIVAGVTGSIPATVDLMQAVLTLEHGAIVLPGFDRSLDDASWDVLNPETAGLELKRAGGALPVRDAFPLQPALPGHDGAAHALSHPDHPQFAMHRLLSRFGATREDVRELTLPVDTKLAARGAFLSQAMRPTATTDQWHTWLDATRSDTRDVEAGLADVHLIEAANALEEAEAISLILREAVETPGKRIALVTPDRLLARRIAIRLAAWNIRVDDSAGRPFAKTVPGAFLDLVVETMNQNFAPAALMALLKHPLCRLGLQARDIRLAARALELLAFRAVYTGTGLAGVRGALQRVQTADAEGLRLSRAARSLNDEACQAAHDLVGQLEDAFAPLTALYDAKDPASISTFVGAHAAVAEALCRVPLDADEGLDDVGTAGAASPSEDASDPDASDLGAAPPSPLYAGEAGTTAASLLGELIAAGDDGPPVAPRDYADLYAALISGNNVLPRVPVHPQISILGVMEARLIDVDIMVLAGLNDGVWPDHADPGPWLNRPMRKALGLPDLEEKIGYSAHDFTSFMAAPKVYLTRAKKTDGVPTVPSRWLMRIQALLRGLDLTDALQTDQPWITWARQRDAVGQRPVGLPAPQPCPPVHARPRRMGVSKVETWMANPYAIFAQSILGLDRLPDLGHAPDASLRGTIIHAAMSQFSMRYPDTLPNDIAGAIMSASQDHFDELRGSPRVWAFWRPRLQRFATWFAETEPTRRVGVLRSMAEVDGVLEIDAPAGPFKLRARADRIDVTDDGIVVTDYKTGKAPAKKAVEDGKRPQLSLEAAIALAGGFGMGMGLGNADDDDLQARGVDVTALRYISATGAEPAGVETGIADKNVSELAEDALRELGALIARFDDPKTPYPALRRSGFSYEYDDYAQLARVLEWSFDGNSGEAS
ncbi:MAG: PD-(D/E)XK nuclease family protein [Pseudomonadota bacterium]